MASGLAFLLSLCRPVFQTVLPSSKVWGQGSLSANGVFCTQFRKRLNAGSMQDQDLNLNKVSQRMRVVSMKSQGYLGVATTLQILAPTWTISLRQPFHFEAPCIWCFSVLQIYVLGMLGCLCRLRSESIHLEVQLHCEQCVVEPFSMARWHFAMLVLWTPRNIRHHGSLMIVCSCHNSCCASSALGILCSV